MSDIAQQLAGMFEGNGEDPGWLPEIGWKPWFPTVGEVWASSGVCPQSPNRSSGFDPRIWAEAWSILERLHAEYLEAKKDK